LRDGFEELEKNVKSADDEKLANKIIDICNKYVWCHDEVLKKEMIIYDLQNTSLNLGEVNGVSETNLETSNCYIIETWTESAVNGIIPVYAKVYTYNASSGICQSCGYTIKVAQTTNT
jgi:hypothetical protein